MLISRFYPCRTMARVTLSSHIFLKSRRWCSKRVGDSFPRLLNWSLVTWVVVEICLADLIWPFHDPATRRLTRDVELIFHVMIGRYLALRYQRTLLLLISTDFHPDSTWKYLLPWSIFGRNANDICWISIHRILLPFQFDQISITKRDIYSERSESKSVLIKGRRVCFSRIHQNLFSCRTTLYFTGFQLAL
jgi:hypothetical protein